MIAAEQLMHHLGKMFGGPSYAFFPQVRNGTGYARGTVRTADALAMGLWPSRGLLLHGFEVKVSRSDWLAELRDPSKADALARYCDRWWLVVSDQKIVETGELPPKWGLIAPEDRRRRGAALRVFRDAENLDAQPLDRLMVASILREGRRGLVPAASVALAAADDVARAHAERDEARADQQEAWRKANAYDALKAALDEFERASGVRVAAYDGRRIGEVVRVLIESGVDGSALVTRLSDIQRAATGLAEMAGRQVELLKTAGTEAPL